MSWAWFGRRCAAIVWLGLLSAMAAGEPAATVPASPPIDDVGAWSKQATQRLFEIKERLSGPSEAEKQATVLEALEGRFDANLAGIAAHPDEAGAMTEAAVRDARSELDAISSATDKAGNELTQRAAALAALIRETSETSKRAESLLAGHDQSEITEAFRSRLESIVGDATRLFDMARQRLDGVDTLQNRVLVLDERLRTARIDLIEADAKRTQALMELQQPPLWRVRPSEAVSAVSGSTRFIGAAIPGALQFAHDHPARVVLYVAAFLILFGLLVHLHRTFETMPTDGPASRAATRPLSASLLVVLLAAPAVYPDAPSSVVQLLGIVAIIPMMRILTLYLEAGLLPVLYGLAATFLLERMTTAFARDIVLQRLALLVLGVATIALISWARSLRIGDRLARGRRYSRIVRLLLLVGLSTSVLSVLFNVVGNVDLALLLQSATVRGIAMAAGLRAAVLVIDEIAYLCVRSLKARGTRSIINNEHYLLTKIRQTVGVLAFAFWVAFMLGNLHALVPLTSAVSALLDARWTLGQVTISLGRMLGFVIAVWAAVHASRITQVLLRDDVLPKLALPRGVPKAIATVANYVMVLMGLLIGAGILGIELSNLALIVSALGVGVGFGLQNVVNNLVSGFILIFERAVQVGDTIQLGDVTGQVTQIGLRASRLQTGNGAVVIIPNGELLSSRLIHWTLSDKRRRLDLTVRVPQRSDQDRVHSILRDVLEAEPEVAKVPQPVVMFEAFGDGSLNFRLQFWIEDLDTGNRVIDRVNTGIARAFEAASIEIPFPQRDVHIRTTPDLERPTQKEKPA